jgi:hypothetical protein
MELLKGMIFLGQHPELFKSKKINKVSALSLVSPGYLEESNEKLMDNYLRLSVLYQKEYHKMLPVLYIDTELTNDAQSFVNQATDILAKSGNLDLRKLLTYSAFDVVRDCSKLDLEGIKKMIQVLREKNESGKMYKVGSANYDSSD